MQLTSGLRIGAPAAHSNPSARSRPWALDGSHCWEGELIVPASEPLDAGDGVADPEAESVEAERRKLRRWFWSLGIIAALAFFGLLRYNYPTLTTASGRTYEAGFSRYRGTDGSWTQLQYFTHASSIDSVLSEVKELAPYAIDAANHNNDSTIHIVAIRRRFRFGLFTLDKSTIFQLVRTGSGWRLL